MKIHQFSVPLSVPLVPVILFLAWGATASNDSSRGYYLMYKTTDCSDKGVKELDFSAVDKKCIDGTIEAYKTVVQLPVSEASDEESGVELAESPGGCLKCNPGKSCSFANYEYSLSASATTGNTYPNLPQLQSASELVDLEVICRQPLLNHAITARSPSPFFEPHPRPQVQSQRSSNYHPDAEGPARLARGFNRTHTSWLLQLSSHASAGMTAHFQHTGSSTELEGGWRTPSGDDAEAEVPRISGCSDRRTRRGISSLNSSFEWKLMI